MLKSRLGLFSLMAAAMLAAGDMAKVPQIRHRGQRGMRHIIGPSKNVGNKSDSRRDRHRAAVKAERDAARAQCPPGMRIERFMRDWRMP